MAARAAGPRTPHPVFWVIAAALVVIAVSLFVRREPLGMIQSALAQPVTSGGARGIFAFSGQLTKNSFGVYMIDVDDMTIWAYEYVPQKSCMRLAAARTWRYDRYLESHNVCDLSPDDVEAMIEQQRKFQLQKTESEMP